MRRAERGLCRGVTLLEVIIVIVIIGIIASISIPQFFKFKERAMEKEAWANLKLIQAAAWIYRIEYDRYPAADLANTGQVNNDLKLDLPLTSNLNYTVNSNTRTSFRAQAGNTTNYWWINETGEFPQKVP